MVGDVVAGRYELEELVGTGGMSSVYRAHDRLLERRVALKILHGSLATDEETVQRFRSEARSAAKLSHPNIVAVIDRGEDGGHQFIVYEYIAGENLKGLVERDGPLPLRRALELAIETGRGLAFAHGHGLIHRDVKPQNVLLNGDGTAKVTDFGIARSLDVAHGLTQTGTILGTSNYIAPEQAKGEAVGEGSDVYALGVVIFELLTGEVPFPAENVVRAAMRHVNDPVPSVLERRPEVPLRLAHAVERALAKEPEGRFRTMADFVSELEACLTGLGEDASHDLTTIVRAPVVPVSRHAATEIRAPAGPAPGEPAPSPRRRRSRRPLLAVLVLLVLAGAAAAAYLLLRDTSSSSGGGQIVRLDGVASYDPEGTDGEHDEDVARATDGDPSTYWPTETYESFGKSGVGLVLDAGEEARPEALTVRTSTPGFTARIDAGSSPDGPFEPISGEQTVQASTRFELDGNAARYFVVWITALPEGVARVSEVTARG